jgi:hypothetical protein
MNDDRLRSAWIGWSGDRLVTNLATRRGDASWMIRASTSLPVPVSPPTGC